MTKEDSDIFNDIFENDLKKALEFVKKDMSENLEDSIDIATKVLIAKRRKMCTSGHINDNVRSNRTICDR
jgi:hypothetical protein